MPDTAAALRASGLELSDTIEELGSLTLDIGAGVRSGAQALSAAEAGARELGSRVMSRDTLLSARRRLMPLAKRGVMLLEERAELTEYSEAGVAAIAESTRKGVSRVRHALQAAGVARKLTPLVGRAASRLRQAWQSLEEDGAAAAPPVTPPPQQQ